MIHEFYVSSRELEFTRNKDGTHRVRVVAAGDVPMEFTCDLRPFLTVRVEIGTRNDRARLANGEHVEFRPQAELDLHIHGDVKPDASNHDWTMRILDRDDCGNPR